MSGTPQSNTERYLSVIAGHGGEIPSEPASRMEYCLDEIAKGGGLGGKLKPEIVAALPATGETGVLYLVPTQGSSDENTHDEYVWLESEGAYELLGQTAMEVDLSEYAKREELKKYAIARREIKRIDNFPSYTEAGDPLSLTASQVANIEGLTLKLSSLRHDLHGNVVPDDGVSSVMIAFSADLIGYDTKTGYGVYDGKYDPNETDQEGWFHTLLIPVVPDQTYTVGISLISDGSRELPRMTVVPKLSTCAVKTSKVTYRSCGDRSGRFRFRDRNRNHFKGNLNPLNW